MTVGGCTGWWGMSIETIVGTGAEPAPARNELLEDEAEPAPTSLDLIYAEVKDRLDVQLRQIDSLDSKAGSIMFIASVVLGIGAAAQSAIVGVGTSVSAVLTFSIPFLFFMGSAIFAARGWVGRPFFRDPEPRPLRDHYLTRAVEFTRRRLLTHFIASYEWNAHTIRRKVVDLRIALLFLLMEIGFLALVLLVRPWVG